MLVDKRFIHIFTDDSQLYSFRHSVPSYFSQPMLRYTLSNNVTQLVPFTLSSAQLFAQVHFSNATNSSSLSLMLNAMSTNDISDDLVCEMYPKPNNYLVQMSAYIESCDDVMRSKSIIMNSSTGEGNVISKADYCII